MNLEKHFKRRMDELRKLGMDDAALSELERLFYKEHPEFLEQPKSVPMDKVYIEWQKAQGEAVLSVVFNPEKFFTVVCKQCRMPFASNGPQTTMCSLECIQAALKTIGIDWNPKTPAESWKGSVYPPTLVVPPEALRLLRSLLESLDDLSPQQPEEVDDESQAV